MLLQKITKSNRLKTALIQQGQAKGVPMQDGIVCEDDSGNEAKGNSGDSAKSQRGRKKKVVVNEV